MGNISREMESLNKEKLEIKNTIKEMENVFDRFISRLYTAEERISEPEDVSVEISKPKIQRK